MDKAQPTILIVEDDLIYLRIITLRLQAEGCTCLTASSHQDALTCLQAHPEIDVMLLDYDVRGSSPAPLLEEWTRMGRHTLIVGHSSMDRAREFEALGIEAFARKPLNADEFLRVAGRRSCAKDG